MVGIAMIVTIITGISVQPISSPKWPCTGFGSSRPGRSRKLQITQTSNTSTTTKMKKVHPMKLVNRVSILHPRSATGLKVDMGEEHPATAKARRTTNFRFSIWDFGLARTASDFRFCTHRFGRRQTFTWVPPRGEFDPNGVELCGGIWDFGLMRGLS